MRDFSVDNIPDSRLQPALPQLESASVEFLEESALLSDLDQPLFGIRRRGNIRLVGRLDPAFHWQRPPVTGWPGDTDAVALRIHMP